MKKLLFIVLVAVVFYGCKKDEISTIPNLTTAEISTITHATVTSGGNITNNGGAEIIARGVCWSTNENPTIADNKTTDGTGSGSFTSSITGLIANTLYYIKAYATSSVGTAYGNQQSFTTLPKFEITNIKCSSLKIVRGQVITFTSVLSDPIGNINYEWKFFFDNQQIDVKSGFNLKEVTVVASKIGEYTLRLNITRGVSDNDNYEIKFNPIEPNFQFGIWGDNEATIKMAELNVGNEVCVWTPDIPVIAPENTGLTTITYSRGGDYCTYYFYIYYFKDGVLMAGAYTKVWTNYQGDDARGQYGCYLLEKTNLETILKTTIPEGKIWNVPSIGQQVDFWDQGDYFRSLAIVSGYLELKTEAITRYGRGNLHLYCLGGSVIFFEYMIASPNL